MLEIKKAIKGNLVIFALTGVIDEEVRWEEQAGEMPNPPLEVHLQLGKVTRINSLGVKSWIEYFRKAEVKRVSLNFWNVSQPLVQQFNQVQNFCCGGQVHSFEAGFECEACHHQFVTFLQAKDVIAQKFNPPKLPCPNCQKVQAVFDEIPEVYFKFLK